MVNFFALFAQFYISIGHILHLNHHFLKNLEMSILGYSENFIPSFLLLCKQKKILEKNIQAKYCRFQNYSNKLLIKLNYNRYGAQFRQADREEDPSRRHWRPPTIPRWNQGTSSRSLSRFQTSKNILHFPDILDLI